MEVEYNPKLAQAVWILRDEDRKAGVEGGDGEGGS